MYKTTSRVLGVVLLILAALTGIIISAQDDVCDTSLEECEVELTQTTSVNSLIDGTTITTMYPESWVATTSIAGYESPFANVVLIANTQEVLDNFGQYFQTSIGSSNTPPSLEDDQIYASVGFLEWELIGMVFGDVQTMNDILPIVDIIIETIEEDASQYTQDISDPIEVEVGERTAIFFESIFAIPELEILFNQSIYLFELDMGVAFVSSYTNQAGAFDRELRAIAASIEAENNPLPTLDTSVPNLDNVFTTSNQDYDITFSFNYPSNWSRTGLDQVEFVTNSPLMADRSPLGFGYLPFNDEIAVLAEPYNLARIREIGGETGITSAELNVILRDRLGIGEVAFDYFEVDDSSGVSLALSGGSWQLNESTSFGLMLVVAPTSVDTFVLFMLFHDPDIDVTEVARALAGTATTSPIHEPFDQWFFVDLSREFLMDFDDRISLSINYPIVWDIDDETLTFANSRTIIRRTLQDLTIPATFTDDDIAVEVRVFSPDDTTLFNIERDTTLTDAVINVINDLQANPNTILSLNQPLPSTFNTFRNEFVYAIGTITPNIGQPYNVTIITVETVPNLFVVLVARYGDNVDGQNIVYRIAERLEVDLLVDDN